MIKEDKKFIVRGISISYLHLLVGFIFIFFLTPIIIRYVGQSIYGIWAILNSIVGYFLLFDFGTNTAIAKYTAEYRAMDNQEAMNRTASTIFFYILLVCALIVFIAMGLTPFIPRIFKIPRELSFTGMAAFLIMAVNVAILLIAGVFGNIIYGYQRVDVWKAFAILQLSTNILLTILFLHIGLGLIGMAVATTISNVMLLVLYLVFLHASGYSISIRLQAANLSTLKEIAPYSARTFVLVLTSRILYYTSSIIIGIFLGAFMVTSYDIAYKLCFYATSLFGVISTTIFPQFSRFYAIGDIKALAALYLNTTKISLAIMSPIAVFFVFFGQPFIELWVGKENFVGMGVFAVFITMNIVHAVGTPAGLLLQGIGENRIFLYSELANALLNLVLSIILVRKIGLQGVALGGLTAQLCTSAWIVPVLACRHTGLPVRKLVSSAIIPPLLVCIFLGLATWIIRQKLFPADNLINLFFNGSMILVVYTIIYLIFCATKSERTMYMNMLPGLNAFLNKKPDVS